MAAAAAPAELPAMSELVAVMREVVAAEDAFTSAVAGPPVPVPTFRELSKRMTSAMNAQRALVARIDTLLAQEFPG